MKFHRDRNFAPLTIEVETQRELEMFLAAVGRLTKDAMRAFIETHDHTKTKGDPGKDDVDILAAAYRGLDQEV